MVKSFSNLFWSVVEDTFDVMNSHMSLTVIELNADTANKILTLSKDLEREFSVSIELKEIKTVEYAKGFMMEKSKKLNIRYSSVSSIANLMFKIGVIHGQTYNVWVPW